MRKAGFIEGRGQMATAANQIRIETRIARFDPNGTLVPDCREIAGLFAEDGVRVAKSFWKHFLAAPDASATVRGQDMDALVQKILPYMAAKYADAGGQQWGDMVEAFVREATAEHVSLTTLISSIAAAAAEGHEILAHKLASEPDRLSRLAKCLNLATLLEADVFTAYFDLLRAEEDRGRRAASATH